MSEFQLYNQVPSSSSQAGYQQQQSSVAQTEWYTPAGGAYSATEFSYDVPSSSAAGAYGTFEDEEPLLTELGIDVPAIWRRSRNILLNRLSSGDMRELDLGGPLLFALVLGSAHLLVGKLHFGVVLGWSVVAGMVVWFVVNHLAGMDNPEAKGLGIYDCCCLLGYCQLPLVLHAFISLLLPRGTVSAALAILAVLWASRSAGKLFTYRSSVLAEHFLLVAYPCLLTYCAFALLSIY